MKKTYINPSIEVVKVETHTIIAASKVGFSSESVGAGSAQGREFDFTEDE